MKRDPVCRLSLPSLLIVPLLLLNSGEPAATYGQEHPGRAIFAQHCASCHGERGQGVETLYPQPLVGDLSVKELANYISAAMPEGEPELCAGPDAAAVAEYIHGEFYSLIAQVRNQPPDLSLSRLTISQYRNSLTDLAASFSWQIGWDNNRGLEAKYYKNRRKNKENLAIERTDPAVEFAFGESSPLPETIETAEFSIEWNGSLYAHQTGWHEIVFATENAGQLWLNDMRTPLIDVRVKSGDQKEYRESIYLLGGRLYPLRLEFYKSKGEKTASVALRWRQPQGIEEPIAERHLLPKRNNTLFVCATDFPPDDKSVGYERGVSVSKEWNDATTRGAMEFADYVMERLPEYAKLPKEPEQQAEKLKEFCRNLVGRAFRRPLSAELQAFFVDRQFERAPDPFTATRRVILLTLKSPRFLFPGAASETWDDFRTAEWLALVIWDSLPDETLLRSAREQKLNTQQQISAQSERMLSDVRTRAKLRGFFHQWLHFEHFQELSKSPANFPEFDRALAADLRTSLDLFLEDIVWSDDSDYRRLLLAEEIFLNGRLAQFYNAELPPEADFTKVRFDPDQRAGLVSHPYLLAGLAYEDASSPIHRGVFVARSLLGRFLKPPPIAIAPEAADLHPGLTTRQRTERQTAAVMCSSCHGMINPLGFSLENFDAVGRFRQTDREQPVNAQGVYIDRSGKENSFSGARGLAQFLVNSEEAQTAFSEQLFQFLVKQPVQALGPEFGIQLKNDFVAGNFHIRRLVAKIATESALTARQQSLQKPAAK